jgi:hypothetical protein
MPSINPYDYNIDNFDSQNLGPISVQNFRDYVLSHNLDEINPEVLGTNVNTNSLNVYSPLLFNSNPKVVDLPNLSEVSFVPSVYNNSTSPRPDNLNKNLYLNSDPFFGTPTEEQNFNVGPTKALTSPGTIDGWLLEGGFQTDVFAIRNFVHLSNNEYGPEQIFDYSNIDGPSETTGYKSYPSTNPLQSNNVIREVVLRTLGFSPTSFVNFPSQMEDIAKERRKFEVESRVKINFTNDTVGLVNLSTTQLLLGNGIITPDYIISRPPGLFSRVANFTSNIAGFTLPVSPLPGSKSTKISSNFFQEELVRYTGRAQKNLIYFNAYSSKYSSPMLSRGLGEGDADSAGGILQNIRNFFKDLGREQTSNYLTISEREQTEQGSLGERIGKFFNDLISPEVNPTLVPTNEKNTFIEDPFVSMGVDGEYPSIETMDENSLFNNKELDQSEIIGEYKMNNTTLRPTIIDGVLDINPSHRSTTSKNFDWRSRTNEVAKRGLLKYTQDMVNASKTSNNRGAAKFIGRFDDDSNLVDINGVPRHSNVSKGNLVRNENDTAYCRSWSTRNPYQNHYDLIRSDRLYKLIGKKNYLSVLEDNGHVRIAPYSDVQNENDPKRYMFSIENLAWLDSDEMLGLPDCEKGPNGGRIMWFPPYDLDFTDNTTANWESTNFIGRSEPIYTYNNTERKGTLSFKVITDHPSVLQEIRKQTEDNIYRFFAGCGLNINDFFPKEVVNEIILEELEQSPEFIEPNSEIDETLDKGDEQTPNPEPPRTDPPVKELKFYFENARRDRLVSGVRKGVGRDVDEELNRNYELPGLNSEFNDQIYDLIDFLATEEGQNWGVEFIGYTSKAAPNDYNKVLSIDRATSVHNWVKSRIKERGQTPVSGLTYVFKEQNFSSNINGFVCKSGQNCLKDTSNDSCFKNPINKCYPNLQIDYIPPKLDDFEKSFEGRFIITAKGEDYAKSKENENPDNVLPKSERYVKIKLFKNEKWTVSETKTILTPRSDEFEILPLPPSTTETQTLLTADDVLNTFNTAKDIEEQKLLRNKNPRRTRIEDDKKNVDVGETENTEVSDDFTKRVVERTVERLYRECDYFIKIKKEDPFIYSTIKEKIKNFHPAFHSTSPEGFNSRLTFLHQCLRQGPSIRPDGVKTRNLAFGRPPVCIIRLGDFYYTRVIIDSLNITYDPLLWDMNPEGIGVQPMIANVDLNFSMIGGSSLSGPITQLQNAVSFNFFANTSVYNEARVIYKDSPRFFKTLEEKLTENAEQLINKNKEVLFGSFNSEEQFRSSFKNTNQTLQNVGTNKDGDQTGGVIQNQT